MIKTLLVISCLVAISAALPSSEDAIVPEEALFQSDADFENTRSELEAMRSSGKSDKDCRELADDTEDDVKKNVKAQQDDLEALDKGQKCPAEGQGAVKKASDALALAESDKKAKDAALDKANNKVINFGDFKFNSLTPGNCDTFFQSTTYKNAAKDVKDAKTAAEVAKGALDTAKKGHSDAVAAAKKAVRDCQCAVKKLHKSTIKKMNDSAEAANKKAWKKAADLRCLLDGTPADKCKVTAIPVVKAVKLTAATEAVKCGPSDLVLFNSRGGYGYDCGKGCCSKNNGGNGWNSDCVDTKQQMKEGGAGFCARRSGSWNHAMIGLDRTDSSDSYTDIEFALYADSGKSFVVYESGSHKYSAGRQWVPGMYGCLWVTANNKVEYWGQQSSGKFKHHYTSVKTAAYPFKVDAAMYSPYSKFDDVHWISARPVAGSTQMPEKA